MEFNVFVKVFNAQLAQLKESERVTRGILLHLSRNLLAALHGKDAKLYGDIQYINAVLPSLTPVNKKVFIAFMKHFTGFHYDEGLFVFTKKSKKRGEEARENALAFLTDPHNNIWTWAERNVSVEVKPFTADKVTEYVEKAIKKLPGGQLDVLRAVMKAGITPANMAIVLQEMSGEQQYLDAKAHGNVVEAAPL